MGNIKVSIIVPVYNVEENLKQCLNSIVNQTLKEIELIIVDDDSTDSSPEICKSYLKDSRVKYLHQKNEGAYAARQTGLECAKGEYIGFVDSDDWIEPEMYERMYNAAKQENADIVVCGVYWDVDKERPENFPHGVYSRERIEKEILPGYLARINDSGGNGAEEAWNLWSKIYKREFINGNHIAFVREFRRTQEMAFNFKALLAANKFVSICNELLYHWRVENNDKSLCRGYSKNFWLLYKPMIKMMYDDVQGYKNQDLMPSMHLCTFFLSSLVLRNEWVYTNLNKKGITSKLDEIAKDSTIKQALQFVPKNKLNSSYQSDYDALMCQSGEEMFRSLKNHSYYKKFRRPIRIKRTLSKYKLFAVVYPKVRKSIVRIVRNR